MIITTIKIITIIMAITIIKTIIMIHRYFASESAYEACRTGAAHRHVTR